MSPRKVHECPVRTQGTAQHSVADEDQREPLLTAGKEVQLRGLAEKLEAASVGSSALAATNEPAAPGASMLANEVRHVQGCCMDGVSKDENAMRLPASKSISRCHPGIDACCSIISLNLACFISVMCYTLYATRYPLHAVSKSVALRGPRPDQA